MDIREKALVALVAILGSVAGFLLFAWGPFYFSDGWYWLREDDLSSALQFGGTSGVFFLGLGSIVGCPTCSAFPTYGVLYLLSGKRKIGSRYQPAVLYASAYLTGLFVYTFFTAIFVFFGEKIGSSEFQEVILIAQIPIVILFVAAAVVVNCYSINWASEGESGADRASR